MFPQHSLSLRSREDDSPTAVDVRVQCYHPHMGLARKVRNLIAYLERS